MNTGGKAGARRAAVYVPDYGEALWRWAKSAAALAGTSLSDFVLDALREKRLRDEGPSSQDRDRSPAVPAARMLS